MKFRKRKKNQLEKEEKTLVNWDNLSNPRFKLWYYDNLIKSKLKEIIKFNP